MKSLEKLTILVLLFCTSCTWFSPPVDQEGISHTSLSNGLTVLLKEAPGRPRVGITALIRISSNIPHTEELLKMRMLKNLLYTQFQEEFEYYDSIPNIEVFGNSLKISCDAPPSQSEKILQALIEMLTQLKIETPAFLEAREHLRNENILSSHSITEMLFLLTIHYH